MIDRPSVNLSCKESMPGFRRISLFWPLLTPLGGQKRYKSNLLLALTPTWQAQQESHQSGNIVISLKTMFPRVCTRFFDFSSSQLTRDLVVRVRTEKCSVERLLFVWIRRSIAQKIEKIAANKMHPFARWKSFIRCLVFSKRLSEPMSFCGAQIHNPNRKGGVPSLTPLTAPPNSGPVSRLTAGYLTKPTPLIADFIASLSVWPHVCVFSRIALHLLTMACCQRERAYEIAPEAV
jgi:hypothetical protein